MDTGFILASFEGLQGGIRDVELYFGNSGKSLKCFKQGVSGSDLCFGCISLAGVGVPVSAGIILQESREKPQCICLALPPS